MHGIYFNIVVCAEECLRRFGREGDKFILVYRDKTNWGKKPGCNRCQCCGGRAQKTAKGCKIHIQNIAGI